MPKAVHVDPKPQEPEQLEELLPDYQRPFEVGDFRGYFTWSKKETAKRPGYFYHACHKGELEQILADRYLGLRSNWSLVLPKHGGWTTAGVWVGLNYYRPGNYHGPFLLQFPTALLEGKQFMVFWRSGARNRYFFVQYEAKIPVFAFGNAKQLWRQVDPKHYFRTGGHDAIWDIVLTQPVPLDQVTIRAVKHPKCIPGKCTTKTLSENHKVLRRVIAKEFKARFANDPSYKLFATQFPDCVGVPVLLPTPLTDE